MQAAGSRTTRTPEESRPAPASKAGRGGGAAQLGTAFDTMRIVGTFLVVFYHASLTYLTRPMRLTLWHIYDPSGHVSMDVLAYWVNGFAMPLFFLAAGVSAPAAVASRGVRVFLRHRVGRLLRPLLFGSLTIVPLCYLLCGYALMETGRCTPDGILSWRFSAEVSPHLYGFFHLWFLEYLFLVCVLWCGCWLIWRRGVGDGEGAGRATSWMEQILVSPWRPLLLAVPTGLIFLLDTDTVLRVENSFLPNPSRLLHYLYFFTVGGWLTRVPEPKERSTPHCRLYLGLAAAVFVVMLPSLLRCAAAPLVGAERIAFAGLAAVFPWLVLLGSLGVCLQRPEGKGATMRFLAESSLWVYLIHLPIVMLIQVLLVPLAWPVLAKFLTTAVLASVLSVLSYEFIARYSLIGEIVNGARKRLKKPGRLGPEFGWIATASVLVLMVAGSVWYVRVLVWEHNLYAAVPGEIWRCGRLDPEELDQVIRREGVRTVVSLGGASRPLWIKAQQRVCAEAEVTFRMINMREAEQPSRETVQKLLAVLEESPRPILLEGYRGLDICSFASTLTLMLDGTPPAEALEQFGAKYTQFGGPRHSILGRTLLSYQDWLNDRQWAHSPTRLKSWAQEQFLAEAESDSLPSSVQSPGAIADGPTSSVTR